MVKRHAKSCGFSMVEVCIALAIVALAAAVVIPAKNNITRADLRSSASLTSTGLRSAYAQAALTGLTHRLTFESGKNTILMESTEAALHFDDKAGAMVSAAEDLDPTIVLKTCHEINLVHSPSGAPCRHRTPLQACSHRD